MLQKHSEVWLYKIHLERPMLTPEEEDTALGQLVEDICIVEQQMHANLKNVQGDVHSSMSMNIKEHIFFVDAFHFYLYTFAK